LESSRLKLKQKSVIPGFGITMGFTLTYLTLLVLIPVSMVFLNSAQIGLDKFLGNCFFGKSAGFAQDILWYILFGCGNKRCFRAPSCMGFGKGTILGQKTGGWLN